MVRKLSKVFFSAFFLASTPYVLLFFLFRFSSLKREAISSGAEADKPVTLNVDRS